MHSECLTGDVFASSRCDCGPQLDEAMERVVAEGRGVVIYLRGHEGRGIGLLAKLQAYQLQDGGRDTVDANLDLGLPADARHYGAATQILKDLGVTSVRLMTNNPAKTEGLESYGVAVTERVALTPHPNDHNLAYLQTKRDRMGHVLPGLTLDGHLDGARPARPPASRRRPSMSGEGSPTPKPIDCHDIRVAILAATWHEQVMDGLLAGAQRAMADFKRRGPGRRAGAGLVRAAGRREGAGRHRLRGGRGARRRHPRWDAALRLRLLGGDRRADPVSRSTPASRSASGC